LTVALCADFGSTWTKLLAVDLDAARLLGSAQARTTADTDVMTGYEEALAELPGRARGADVVRLACSSAGGGLRLAVVGYEQVISAEAGHRVALSAGSRVVHVTAGPLDDAAVGVVRQARPDVLLLVGGTDGGDERVLLHNASRLAAAALGVPVVVAGNANVRDRAEALLTADGSTAIGTANVLPDIGVLDPRPARLAIRRVFLEHVIAGKGLSTGPDFAAMVRAATPDAVLTGVELLADELGTDLLVVDVGGATTDVYSVVTPHGEDAGLAREAVEPMWRGRTVEGDLGMRWSAPGVIAAAAAERLLEPAEEPTLRAAAERRAADPRFLPESPDEAATDARIASLAAVVAVRRHARPHEGSGGRDLRGAALLVGSGGVLRHAPAPLAADVLAAVLDDAAGGWQRPEHAVSTVDSQYVLAAAGLLDEDYPDVARRLLDRHLMSR
jgi:uncharacterized protein (TIGR01319 family)